MFYKDFEVKLIISPSTDPYFNLALEQYIFDEMDRSHEYFMLWQNDNCIIVGVYQNTINEIKQDVVKERNIKVVRRLSGGGAVYEDMGNLSFTYVTDQKDKKAVIDFSVFLNPVASALAKLGVAAEVNGRNDITIDGKKFSGNAQYIKQGRVMHHGTMLFDCDLSVVGACLNVSKEKMAAKGVQSVASRVTNIKDYMDKSIDMAQFKKALLAAMFEQGELQEYTLTAQDIERINRIKEQRYILDEWNYGKSPIYNFKRKKRFEGVGSIEVYAELDESTNCLKSITLHGDFFSKSGIDGLLKELVGLKLERQAFVDKFSAIEMSDFITALTLEQWLELFFEQPAQEPQ